MEDFLITTPNIEKFSEDGESLNVKKNK